MVVNIDQLQYAQDQGFTIGVVSTDGASRERKEIDDFVKDTDVLNLYLLALIDLQRTARWEDHFSYFQIAGIHGKPYAPWDGVTPQQGAPPSQDLERGLDGRQLHEPATYAGYCSHSSNLFPTWHRESLQKSTRTEVTGSDISCRGLSGNVGAVVIPANDQCSQELPRKIQEQVS